MLLVGEEGLEPSLHCWNQILSLARLPIPPLAQITIAQARLRMLRNPPLAQITIAQARLRMLRNPPLAQITLVLYNKRQ